MRHHEWSVWINNRKVLYGDEGDPRLDLLRSGMLTAEEREFFKDRSVNFIVSQGTDPRYCSNYDHLVPYADLEKAEKGHPPWKK